MLHKVMCPWTSTTLFGGLETSSAVQGHLGEDNNGGEQHTVGHQWGSEQHCRYIELGEAQPGGTLGTGNELSAESITQRKAVCARRLSFFINQLQFYDSEGWSDLRLERSGTNLTGRCSV